MYTIEERKRMDRERFYRMNEEWVDNQLKAAGSTEQTATVVKNIIKAINDSNLPKNFDLDVLVMNALSLIKGHPIASGEENYSLTDLVRGEYTIKDRVRVRTDAYDGDHGVTHNGRVGVITHITGDKVRVRYEGASADEVVSHNYTALQKIV